MIGYELLAFVCVCLLLLAVVLLAVRLYGVEKHVGMTTRLLFPRLVFQKEALAAQRPAVPDSVLSIQQKERDYQIFLAQKKRDEALAVIMQEHQAAVAAAAAKYQEAVSRPQQRTNQPPLSS